MITIVALNDDIVAMINFYALHYNYKTEEFLKIAVLIFKWSLNRVNNCVSVVNAWFETMTMSQWF